MQTKRFFSFFWQFQSLIGECEKQLVYAYTRSISFDKDDKNIKSSLFPKPRILSTFRLFWFACLGIKLHILEFVSYVTHFRGQRTCLRACGGRAAHASSSVRVYCGEGGREGGRG